MRLNSHPSGRHFLQIPGPTNVPDRILRAMDYPTIDHRGPEFNALAKKVLRSIRQVFQTRQPVIVYPASGTGAWEAALVNTLSAGDLVLMWETGHFASLWKKMADKLGIKMLEVRHEGVGCGMADGWARVTRTPGVCTATCGPAQRRKAAARPHGTGPPRSGSAARTHSR